MLTIISTIVAVLSGAQVRKTDQSGNVKARNTYVVIACVSALVAIYSFLVLTGVLTT